MPARINITSRVNSVIDTEFMYLASVGVPRDLTGYTARVRVWNADGTMAAEASWALDSDGKISFDQPNLRNTTVVADRTYSLDFIASGETLGQPISLGKWRRTPESLGVPTQSPLTVPLTDAPIPGLIEVYSVLGSGDNTGGGTIGSIAGLQAALDGKAPITHKSRHATGGADALTPGDIGAATATALAQLEQAINAALLAYQQLSGKGAANGYMGLDGSGLAPIANIPQIPLTKLAQSGASVGQTQIWNGTNWAPSTPSAGGGGSPIETAGPAEVRNTLAQTGDNIAIMTFHVQGAKIGTIGSRYGRLEFCSGNLSGGYTMHFCAQISGFPSLEIDSNGIAVGGSLTGYAPGAAFEASGATKFWRISNHDLGSSNGGAKVWTLVGGTLLEQFTVVRAVKTSSTVAKIVIRVDGDDFHIPLTAGA